jgi:hypothetical protein
MPVTPAHAALALPLSRAAPALPLAPLVIGTLSPDFEYLLWLSPTGRFAHSLVGLVVFCVPVSLLVWGMWRAIVHPAFERLLPPGMAAMMSEGARAAPRSVAALAGLGALAALLGALSHVAWDAFTHANGWAVAHLPVLRGEASLGWPLGVRWYRVLQHASSVVGMAVVVVWGASWVASVPRPARVFAPGQAARSLGVALALLGVAVATGTFNALRASSDKVPTVLGFAAVGAMAGLVLAALVYGVVTRRARP